MYDPVKWIFWRHWKVNVQGRWISGQFLSLSSSSQNTSIQRLKGHSATDGFAKTLTRLLTINLISILAEFRSHLCRLLLPECHHLVPSNYPATQTLVTARSTMLAEISTTSSPTNKPY